MSTVDTAADALVEAQRRLEQLELLVDERANRSAAKPWNGRLLDVVQKHVELTIDNGTLHETVRFRAWGQRIRGVNERRIFQRPAFFFVDIGSGWNAIPVAKIHVHYGQDDNKQDVLTDRTYRFKPNDEITKPDTIAANTLRNRIARRLGVDANDAAGKREILAYVRKSVYAAHLCFLALTGTDLAHDAYTDFLGVHREPSDRYTIQPVTCCVRCTRKLTAPASIDAAFGPDCQKIVFGSAEAYNTRILGGKR